MPVGALLMSDAVYEGVFDSLANAVSHGSTFAPNDLAMVAGLATLRELDDAGPGRAQRAASASGCSSGRARWSSARGRARTCAASA